MTFALAIGYDWLYDQLDDASRKEIRTAIVERVLAAIRTSTTRGPCRTIGGRCVTVV